jgi:hypothetical protein
MVLTPEHASKRTSDLCRKPRARGAEAFDRRVEHTPDRKTGQFADFTGKSTVATSEANTIARASPMS